MPAWKKESPTGRHQSLVPDSGSKKCAFVVSNWTLRLDPKIPLELLQLTSIHHCNAMPQGHRLCPIMSQLDSSRPQVMPKVLQSPRIALARRFAIRKQQSECTLAGRRDRFKGYANNLLRSKLSPVQIEKLPVRGSREFRNPCSNNLSNPGPKICGASCDFVNNSCSQQEIHDITPKNY